MTAWRVFTLRHAVICMPFSSFTNIYNDHQNWLKLWILRRVGCNEQAADLAQDTFVRVLQQKPVEMRQPRAYLSSIARNVMVDWLRRRTIEQAYLETLAAQDEPTAISPECRQIMIDTLVEVDRLLDGLNPRSREIFLLAQLDGMSFVAIGAYLGLSVTSVRKHFIRAMTTCLSLIGD